MADIWLYAAGVLVLNLVVCCCEAPGRAPPRWSMRDRLRYRALNFRDMCNLLDEQARLRFESYLEQAIAYEAALLKLQRSKPGHAFEAEAAVAAWAYVPPPNTFNESTTNH